MLNILLNISFRIGLHNLIRSWNQLNGKVPILVFHRISHDENSTSEPISPLLFSKMIKFLKKEYDVRPLSDIFIEGIDVSKCCFITFDDATLDFYDNALPMLKEEQIPFTQFVPTEAINLKDAIWTNKLFAAWDSLDQRIQVAIEDDCVMTLEPKPQITDVLKVVVILRQRSSAERDFFLTQLYEKVLVAKRIEHMSWAQLQECKAFGSLGSHSVSHPDLKHAENLHREILVSKENMAQQGLDADYFAYPFGSFDEKVIDIVLKNYLAAFTTEEKLLSLKKGGSKYTIPRISILNEGIEKFAFRINGVQSALRGILWKVNKFKRHV